MSRPIWKGQISFGLVNIPVVLYSAEKKSDIKFNLLDTRDKSRIRYVRINEQTGKEVPWSDIAKGYEYEDGNYVVFEEKELKDIAGDNFKIIAIESFVNKAEINVMEYETPYYLVPEKKGEKGYVILREILQESKKVGIAKVIIHSREYLATVMPFKDALILNLLRYSQELRNPDEFELPQGSMKDYKINAKEMNVAKQLVNSMTGKWNPKDYEDEYRIQLEKAIQEKIAKVPTSKMKKRGAVNKSNVIDFMSLLQQSLASKNKKLKVKSKAASMKRSPQKIIRKKKRGK